MKNLNGDHSYSPFQKVISQLDALDLEVLRSVSEGWYIEYKREITDATSMAKSISAFANTYGGWIFYGVAEKSKEHPVAGSFPGIAIIEVDATLQRMRQAIAGHLSPSAHFDTKVIYGPCESIGLNIGCAVICVSVPWSPIAPHVHKSGRIYRRVADGSEPRPENDRFVLDQLWQRSLALKTQFAEWHDLDPELSDDESMQPYIRLLIAPSLWHERQYFEGFNVQDIREIMGHSQPLLRGVTFDTVFTSSPGFIARQCRNNNPQHLTLTWRLRGTLAGEVLIPLRTIEEKLELLPHLLRGYENAERFTDILKRAGFTKPRIVDLNSLFDVLTGIVEIQRRLQEKAGWTCEFFVKAKLLNVWRTCPFVDVSGIIDVFETHGVPMCLNRNLTSPSGTSPDTFAPVGAFTETEDQVSQILLQTFMVFMPVAHAFGIPPYLETPDDKPFHIALQAAAKRAQGVNRVSTDKPL